MKFFATFRRRCIQQLSASRPGVSLIEILLFVSLLAFAGLVIVDLLLLTADSQLRQRTVSDVEQGGIQIAQLFAYEIRHAERILSPPAAQSGVFLVLQTSDPDANPTVIGVATGAVLVVEKRTEYPVSDPLVTVTDFVVWNTSPSSAKPSVRITFTLTRKIPLPILPNYSRSFDIAVTGFPDDETQGGTCGSTTCAAPTCPAPHQRFLWSVCDEDVCATGSGSLRCP